MDNKVVVAVMKKGKVKSAMCKQIFKNIGNTAKDKERTIRKLNEIGKRIENAYVFIPPQVCQQKAQEEIESILSGSGKVTLPYTRSVFIAYAYANTHVNIATNATMLDDIKAGLRIIMSQYR